MLLGFDIGGTKCAVVIGNNGEDKIQIIDKEVIATDKPVYEMIDLLFATAENLLSKHRLSKQNISGIGISCGGPLSSKQGIILSPPNLVGWDNIPIVEITKKKI